MRLNNLLNNTKSYLNGFNDVYSHQTVDKKILGLLKIASYALIIPPLVACFIYLKNKKIVDLQKELDGKFDAILTKKIFEKIIVPQENTTQQNQATIQNKIIPYLVNKLKNFEEEDNEEEEQKRFEVGFRQLSFDDQKIFFESITQPRHLQMAFQWIPKDIENLNFVSGPLNPIYYSKMNERHIEILLKNLDQFKSLKQINLNLQGLGFYTPSMNTDICTMGKFSGFSFSYTKEEMGNFQVNGIDYYHENNGMPILRSIESMKKLIQAQPNLTWHISLTNFGINGEGTEVQGLYNGYENTKENMENYLKK
jgi:hypothetical protein